MSVAYDLEKSVVRETITDTLLKNANRLNLNHKRTESDSGYTQLEFMNKKLPYPIKISIHPEIHTFWACFKYFIPEKKGLCGLWDKLRGSKSKMEIYRDEIFLNYMGELVRDLPVIRGPIILYGGGD